MSADDARKAREALTQSLNANGPDNIAGVCTAWVYVAEWADGTGRRWLSVNSGNAAGDELPSWTKTGMLNEALNGDWPVFDPDDDND